MRGAGPRVPAPGRRDGARGGAAAARGRARAHVRGCARSTAHATAPVRAPQERLDARLSLYTVDETLLAPEQRKALPAAAASAAAAAAAPGASSKPLFLVWKQRVLVAKVAGANAPELEAAVADNLPAVPAG